MCQDILEEIGNFVAQDDDPDAETSQCLAYLARVCKIFNVTFEKMLWASLPSVVPLLRLLSPLRLNAIVVSGPYAWSLESEEGVSPEDWARFLRRASMVRKLHRQLDCFSPSVWACISKQAAGQILLPRMRELDWRFDRPESMVLELSLLISPCLERLALDFSLGVTEPRDFSEHVRSMVETVVSLAPDLAGLHLTTNSLPLYHLSRHLPLISMLRRLSELSLLETLYTADFDMLRMLSSLKTLTKLVVGADLPRDPLPDLRGFRVLEQLHVMSHPSAEKILELLAMVSSPKLLNVAFNDNAQRSERYVVSLWGPQDFLAVCDELARRFSMLEQIEIAVRTKDVDSLDLAIARLASLRSLKKVDIRTTERPRAANPMVSVSDALFAPLAAGWPHLVYFRLSVTRSTGCVTPGVLVKVADGCPKLRELHMPRLDVTAATVGDVGMFPTRKHPLAVLCVQHAHIADDQVCAGIVYGLFPFLSIENSSGYDAGDAWKRMARVLAVAQLLRS
ncbi:hypothetical protein K466DRAFT_595607 [Polyporus arcularius HHB13444]|uniref:F-box domain-containing protein n=1 Tax=Polyporus arcularius HHB13444 TaxID=1314778 RepID=A0A5C3PRB3_9APHY|nr:hypothetical protein K466DRAFT_595607 [Polyporus arcularius HHB13444]